MDDLSCFLTINATHDNKYENDYKDLGDLILQMLIGNTSQNIELSSEANSIIDDLTNKKKYENIKRRDIICGSSKINYLSSKINYLSSKINYVVQNSLL